VILCGGAINSPQLLLLSGIGPADDLIRLGIRPVSDLVAVGENLQDHLALGLAYECKRPVSLATAESAGSVLRFLLLRRGHLTSNVAEAGAFPREYPKLQFHFGPVWFLEHGFRRPEGHGFSLGPTLIRPESRGNIRLRSDDPFEAPSIHPRYLSEEGDLIALLDGLKLTREIVGAHAFDAYRGDEASPGSNITSDEELIEYIRNSAETLYHPVGTCSMGEVVDESLRVFGTEQLRVVDASVMPRIPSGNTNAATLMIAEKAAAMIRAPQLKY
jgi:choline dehydrogenase-like flavoprotein